MNSYCINYSKHLMFSKPTLAPAAVAICKLALNEVNLGLEIRTIRYALGIGQDMLNRKWASLITDAFKLQFSKDAKLGQKFTLELIRLVAKGILVPAQRDGLAKVFHLSDGTFVQKWEITKALSDEVIDGPYLNTFFGFMNKKGKEDRNFPPWEGRNYKFKIAHSTGGPHEVIEKITEPEWSEEDLSEINSKDDWKKMKLQEVVVQLNKGSVHYISLIIWNFIENILKNRITPSNATDKEIKKLMIAVSTDCESVLTITDISPEEIEAEEITTDFKCNSMKYFNGSYASPSPTEDLYYRLDEQRLVQEYFTNIRVLIMMKYIDSEYTKGYKDLLNKYGKITSELDVVMYKNVFNDREREFPGFLGFYRVTRGKRVKI